MFHKVNPPDQSPTVVAALWVDRQLVRVLKALRWRMRKRVILTSLGTAVTSCVGVFSLSSFEGTFSVAGVHGAIGASLLAIVVSLMSAAALYPILRERDHWLLHAVSTISHEKVELLSVLGKLTEISNGETAGHNLRVTFYTLLFAEAISSPHDEIVRSIKGALLHDVGKLAVSDQILCKPGKLTPDEFAEMTNHVRFGLDIISQSVVLQDASPVVGAHHERYDGTGYPNGLTGAAIPREARLFALIDVFDALTSPRVYKPAYGFEQAMEMMAEGRGSHFDPDLFDRFVELVPEFVAHLPKDETALAVMLMDRLLPYFDRLVLERALPSASTIPSPATRTVNA